MWSKEFWLSLLERAVKTLCQTAVALLTANATGLLDVDWLPLLSASGLAALVSVLTSVGSNAITKTGPSVTSTEVLPELVVARHAAPEDPA